MKCDACYSDVNIYGHGGLNGVVMVYAGMNANLWKNDGQKWSKLKY